MASLESGTTQDYRRIGAILGLAIGDALGATYEFSLTNTGNETFDYNPNNFKVQDSNGVQQTPRNPPQLPYAFNHGSLASDGTLQGNMVFQVPQGDEGLSLVYEPFERRILETITVML